MKTTFRILIFVKIIMFFSFSTLQAASTTGLASVYKVTMKKVELCTASTSVSSCVGAVVIGNTEKVVDIASVNAGVAAATFGDPALLPLGVTYTHMRVTIDRKFMEMLLVLEWVMQIRSLMVKGMDHQNIKLSMQMGAPLTIM